MISGLGPLLSRVAKPIGSDAKPYKWYKKLLGDWPFIPCWCYLQQGFYVGVIPVIDRLKKNNLGKNKMSVLNAIRNKIVIKIIWSHHRNPNSDLLGQPFSLRFPFLAIAQVPGIFKRLTLHQQISPTMVSLSFLLVVIAALILFYFATGKNVKVLFYFLIWQIIVSTLALLNIFEQRSGLFVGVIIGTVVLTIISLKNIKTIVLNGKLLLSIHILRIPVELVLYQLYLQHKVPLSMTFKGINFDIVMGISAAILLGYSLLSNKNINRNFFIVWNILGIGFLLFIVALAILSSPLPLQQFAFDQPNIAVLIFPYCLLPAAVVPIVLMSHLLLLREEKKA